MNRYPSLIALISILLFCKCIVAASGKDTRSWADMAENEDSSEGEHGGLKDTPPDFAPTLTYSSSTSSPSSIKAPSPVRKEGDNWRVKVSSNKKQEKGKPASKSPTVASSTKNGDAGKWWILKRSSPTEKQQSPQTTTSFDFGSSTSSKRDSSPMYKKIDPPYNYWKKPAGPTTAPTEQSSLPSEQLDSSRDSWRNSTPPTTTPIEQSSFSSEFMLNPSAKSFKPTPLPAIPMSSHPKEHMNTLTILDPYQESITSLPPSEQLPPLEDHEQIEYPGNDSGNVMSICLFDHHTSLAPSTGYTLSADMYTLVSLHDDTVRLIRVDSKGIQIVIKVPSPIQTVTTSNNRLIVLTKTRLILFYDMLTGKMLTKKFERLGIKETDILDVHGMILHDSHHLTFVAKDSLWAVDLKDRANPKMVAENVGILNEKSMWVAYFTVIKPESIAEEGGDVEEESLSQSINVYDVVKGTIRQVLIAPPGVYVTASQEYLYILSNQRLNVYDMANNEMVLEGTPLDEVYPGDLIKYNEEGELWVLKGGPKLLCKYSTSTGRLFYQYNLNVNNQVVYPNEDWSAFQIGDDMTTLNDFRIARFESFDDALGFQMILPQRSKTLQRAEFNGKMVLQASSQSVHLVDVIKGSLPMPQHFASHTHSRLWLRGIYDLDYGNRDTVFHQFYDVYNVSITPKYQIKSYNQQNTQLLFTKQIPGGSSLAFFSWEEEFSEEEEEVSEEGTLTVGSYSITNPSKRPIWFINGPVMDVPNSHYVWDVNKGVLLYAVYGNIAIKTGIKHARAVCALKEDLYVLTAEKLSHFRLPVNSSSGKPAKFKVSSSEITDYSQYTAMIHIPKCRDVNSAALVLFNGVTGRVEFRKPSSMQLQKEVDLGLKELLMEEGNRASFLRGEEEDGKQQLWLTAQSNTKPFSLFLIKVA